MAGYVYIMSNEAMPGIYKIGCTSRTPWERADELYTTGVPKPFIIEYCIYIDNYQQLEKRIHTRLAEHNFNKEFFKLNLKNCILELKNSALELSSYEEKYRNDHLRSQVEGWEATYLQKKEAEERKKREELAAREAKELSEKREREIRQKQEEEKSRTGCTTFFICIGIAFFCSLAGYHALGLIVIGIGIYLYFLILDNW